MDHPTRRWRSRRRGQMVGVALVATLTIAGMACGGDDGAEPRSALVESMWAQDDPVVEATSPDVLQLPGPGLPKGVVLSDVMRPDPPAPADPDPLDPSGAAQTLYADPDAASPEAGPELLIGRTQASDIEGRLILVEGDVGGRTVAGDPVDVGHDDATRVEVDGLVVIRWPLPVDCACDQQGFVAARGVDADDLEAAARAADVVGRLPSIPAEARHGLESLGTVAAEVRYFPGWSAFPELLTLRHDDGEVELRVHQGDPRMVAHVRFWSPDGDVPSPFPTLHRVTVLDDGTIVHATASSDDVAQVEPVIDEAMASLVPATDEQVDAAQAEILAAVRLPPCQAATGAPGEPVQADLHGTAGDARWVVGVASRDGAISTCEMVAPAGVSAGGGGGGGPAPTDADPTAPLTVVSGGTTGALDGSTFRFVIGHTATDVTDVGLVLDGIEGATAATMSEQGPGNGRHWFAAVLDVTPFGLQPPSGTLIARRADGTEVGQVPLLGGP